MPTIDSVVQPLLLLLLLLRFARRSRLHLDRRRRDLVHRSFHSPEKGRTNLEETNPGSLDLVARSIRVVAVVEG